MSPKGGVAAKSNTGSVFSSSDRKGQVYIPAAAASPISGSPSKMDSLNESAANAQHWSPLGHGASAFSGSQAEDIADDVTSAVPEEDPAQQGSRSPLRALSSNSPTRLRSMASGSLNEALSMKSRPPTAHDSAHASPQGHSQSQDNNDYAPTMVLKSSAFEQQSPLPANALVAYSSDDDDHWQDAAEATESKFLHALDEMLFSTAAAVTCAK